MTDVEPTPKQTEILDLIRIPAEERPTFPADLARDLRAQLEEGTAGVASELRNDRLFINKHKIKAAHGCEGHAYSQHHEPFQWNVGNVRGTLCHGTIERVIGSGYRLAPFNAAESLFDYLERNGDDRSPAVFLQSLDAGERAELLASVVDAVTKFALDFPRLKPSWNPRVESAQNLDLHGGAISLRGKVDLAAGSPSGTRSGVFIADLKSGYEHSNNIYDVRFYALLETIVRGVPPFRVAVYYLDSGTTDFRDVSLELLESEIHRVIDGIEKYHAALGKRLSDLTRTPSGICRWCLLFRDCEPGQAHDRERSEL